MFVVLFTWLCARGLCSRYTQRLKTVQTSKGNAAREFQRLNFLPREFRRISFRYLPSPLVSRFACANRKMAPLVLCSVSISDNIQPTTDQKMPELSKQSASRRRSPLAADGTQLVIHTSPSDERQRGRKTRCLQN